MNRREDDQGLGTLLDDGAIGQNLEDQCREV